MLNRSILPSNIRHCIQLTLSHPSSEWYIACPFLRRRVLVVTSVAFKASSGWAKQFKILQNHEMYQPK